MFVRADLRCVRLATVICFLPLAACGFEAPSPLHTPPPAAPPAPVSMVSATLTVPLADVTKALNARTQNTIADLRNQPVACMIANCSLDLIATRTGEITGAASGGAISFAVPLAVSAHVAMKGGFFRTSAEGEAQGMARTNTTLQLAPDWRIRTHTSGSIVLNHGELRLGQVKADMAELWNHNAAHISDALFRVLDREIAGHLKVKPAAARLWTRLQTPIRIGKRPEAWLLLAPQQVFVAEPATRGDALMLSLGLAVRAHVFVADHPPEEGAVAPLPSPALLAAPSDRFAVTVPILLPYGTAARNAMQRLAKQPLGIAGMSVRVTNLAILPSGRDVIVAARFCVKQPWDVFGWFDACGAGYLRGVPEYVARTQTIHVANLRYDVPTENLLLSTLKPLAGRTLGQALEAKLVFNVGDDIAKLEREVTVVLAKPRGGAVRISGTVESFGAPSLSWTNDGFLATFIAKGHVAAELNERST